MFQTNMTLKAEKRLESEAEYIKNNIKKRINPSDIKTKHPFILFKKGKILYTSSEIEEIDLKAIKKLKNNFSVVHSPEGKDAFYLLSFAEPYSGKIIVIEEESDDALETTLYLMYLLLPLIFVLLYVLGNSMLNRIILPLKRINQSARSIDINNINEKLPLPKHDDELKELTETFNDMICRLKEGIERIERFNSDISHELKTPLTIINGEIELALSQPRDSKYYEQSIKTISVETRQLNAIIDTLLLLTKYDKSNIQKTFVYTDFNTLLIDVAEVYLELAEKKDIAINFQHFTKSQKSTNPILVTRIFSNIIDNAIKYTKPGGSIEIDLFQDDQGIHFIVTDTGIGIATDELPKITDSLYRVDPSRNKSINGYGLGLSIVKKSTDALNASFSIESKLGIGTKIHIIF